MTDTESELAKRLRDTAREILDWHGDTMHNWDIWREAIATGEKASWPRDEFEALMEDHAEKMREAASALSRYEAALRAIRDCATPEVEDAGFQRRARYDLQEIARAALEKKD